MAAPRRFGPPVLTVSPEFLRHQHELYQNFQSLRAGTGYPAKKPVEVTKWPPLDEHVTVFRPTQPLPSHRTFLISGHRRPRSNEPANMLAEPQGTQSRLRFRQAIHLAHRIGLSYKRIVGYGGMGLCILFFVEPDGPQSNVPRRTPGYPQRIVIKMPIKADKKHEQDMQIEKGVMGILRRSKHILKRISVQEILAQPSPNEENIFQTVPGDEEKGPTLAMEYMEGGSLQWQLIRLLTKKGTFVPGHPGQAFQPAVPAMNGNWAKPEVPFIAPRPDEWVPRELGDEELWRILECLVKGCIAMAYPPRAQPQNQEPGGPPYPALQNIFGPDFPETVPPPGVFSTYGENFWDIVHSDLDAGNVFVQGFEPGEHSRGPLLKIADFGLARTWQKNDSWERLWRVRKAGKHTTFVPEQFTEEWDCYTHDPTKGWPQKHGPALIAGQYSSASNIYQIGLILWSCITYSRPRERPWAEYVTIRPIHGGPPFRGQSHGYDLAPELAGGAPLPWTNTSLRLKEVVMQCMMHRPSERPTLAQLAHECQQQIATFTDHRQNPAFDSFTAPEEATYRPTVGDRIWNAEVGTQAWYEDKDNVLDLKNQLENTRNFMTHIEVMGAKGQK